MAKEIIFVNMEHDIGDQDVFYLVSIQVSEMGL